MGHGGGDGHSSQEVMSPHTGDAGRSAGAWLEHHHPGAVVAPQGGGTGGAGGRDPPPGCGGFASPLIGDVNPGRWVLREAPAAPRHRFNQAAGAGGAVVAQGAGHPLLPPRTH